MRYSPDLQKNPSHRERNPSAKRKNPSGESNEAIAHKKFAKLATMCKIKDHSYIGMIS